MATSEEGCVKGLDITNVVAAFSEEHAQRITGLSKGRLRYWRKSGFFVPTFIEEDHHLPYSRFYSFKDLVALRTLELLRVQNNVPLQHLRKVADKLSHLKDELWTCTALFVANRKVALVNPETEQQEEVISGQYLLAIPLEKVISDTIDDMDRLRMRSANQIGQVRQSKFIVHNAWVVAGTRIPVGTVQRLHEDGYSVKAIIAEYPDLTPADVTAALAHRPVKAA